MGLQKEKDNYKNWNLFLKTKMRRFFKTSRNLQFDLFLNSMGFDFSKFLGTWKESNVYIYTFIYREEATEMAAKYLQNK